MFWNGRRWIDERAPVTEPPPARGRGRDWWLATGVMIVRIVAPAIPSIATKAASSSADRLMASFSGSSETQVVAGLWKTRRPHRRRRSSASGLVSRALVVATLLGGTRELRLWPFGRYRRVGEHAHAGAHADADAHAHADAHADGLSAPLPLEDGTRTGRLRGLDPPLTFGSDPGCARPARSRSPAHLTAGRPGRYCAFRSAASPRAER